MTDFSRTRKALQVWDDTRNVRTANWAKVVDLPTLKAAEAEDAKAYGLVHKALYEDTQEFNNLEQCQLIYPDDPWLRSVAAEEQDARIDG